MSRPGRRCYSRLTMQRQATPHGLSARITRDSLQRRETSCHPPLAEFPSACGGSGVSATGEASLQSFDDATPSDSSRPLRSHYSRLSKGEKHHATLRLRCFPPLAEGRACQRLGRRLYSRLTMHRQTTSNGLSARVPRDSPEERNSMQISACDVSLRLRRVSRNDWGGASTIT